MLQGSIQDVLRAYEEVTLLMGIFSDHRRDADADDSEIYKMTEEMANTTGKVISVPRRQTMRNTWRQTMRNNVEADYEKQSGGRP